MHRSKSWKTRATKVRSQRNRLDSPAGSFNESFVWDFRSETLPSGSTFQRTGATATVTRGPVTQNLLKHSNTLSNADTGWSPSSELSLTLDATATTPIGGVNAPRLLKLTGTTMNQQLTQTIAGGSIAAGTVVTLVFWARAGTGSIADNVKLQVGMYGSANFATASNATVLSGSGTITGAGLQSVDGLTSAWSKFRVTFTAVDSATHTIRFYPGVAGSQPVGLNVYVWGVQLYYGARTDMPFVETTSAPITNPSVVKAVAANTPRFVRAQALYDRRSFPTQNPVLSRDEPIGLLMEGESTNRVLHSEDQSNAAWTTSANATKSGKSLVVPDPTGQLGFNKITNSVPTTNVGVRQTFAAMGFVPPQGARFTISVWMATESGTGTGQIGFSSTGGGPTIFAFSGITTTPRRYAATFNTGAANSSGFIQIGTSDASILWWGAQFEQNPAVAAGADAVGSNPSSYIPTTTSSVKREAEALLIPNTGNRMGFNRRKGTLSVSGYLMQGGAEGTGGPIPMLCGFISASGGTSQAIYLAKEITSAACLNGSSQTINAVNGNALPAVNASTPPAVMRSRVSYSVDLEVPAPGLNSSLLSAQSPTVFNQGTGVDRETFMEIPDMLSLFNAAVIDPSPIATAHGAFVVETVRYIPNYLRSLQARELAQSFLQGTAPLEVNGDLGYIATLPESNGKFPSLSGGGTSFSQATTWTCPATDEYFAVVEDANGQPAAYSEVYAVAGPSPGTFVYPSMDINFSEPVSLSVGVEYGFQLYIEGRPATTFRLRIFRSSTVEEVARAIINYNP